MRFSCPACVTPFDIADANLAPREALELDCPGCRRTLLLTPTPTGDWGITPIAAPPAATPPAAVPPGVVPQPAAPAPPPAEKKAEPAPPAPKPATLPKDLELPPRIRPQSSGFRDLSGVKLDLPDPIAKKPPPPANMWQEFSVMFRLDQAEKGRRAVVGWTLAGAALLGVIGALLGIKLSHDRGQQMLKETHDDLAALLLPYQTSDADKDAPGTVLSRKLAMTQRFAHPPKAVPLPESPTAEAEPVPMPAPATPAVATAAGTDLKQKLEATCKAHQEEMAACARRFLVPRPLRVRFIVNATGHAESVRVGGGGDQHEAFQGCVARTLRLVDLGAQVLELRYTCTVP